MNRIDLAHVSDLHIPTPDRLPPLRALMCKRFFSWLSWRRNRRFVHKAEVLKALMADVRAAHGGHLVVTGDLTNLALPQEFINARDWLAGQGGADAVTVIPGNHDALVPVAWDQGQGLWGEWMGPGVSSEGDYPFVKRVGEAALVGVSSAIPTGLFMATGRVGETQLKRLEETLVALGREGAFRVVLVHHPITAGAVSRRKELLDQSDLRAVLARAGAELVLHGHAHTASVESVPGPAGPIPVVGAPSASAAFDAHGEPAGWRRIVIEPSNAAWRLSVSARTLQADGTFVEREDLAVEISRQGT